MRAVEKVILVANIILLAFATVSFFLLPETIVHHWGPDGPDRIGSRYYIFTMPLVFGAVAFISLLIPWWYEKKDPANCEMLRYFMLVVCIVIVTVCMIGTLMMLVYNN